MISPHPDVLSGDRVLVVNDDRRDQVAEFLQARYPDWTVQRADTYLTGIAELGNCPVRAVVARIDPAYRRLDDAIVGLREAGGEHTRILLCCPPQAEPRTRELLRAGADDYLVLPLRADEVDQALGVPDASQWQPHEPPPAPLASMEELVRLGETLAGIDNDPVRVLQSIADMVRLALGSASAAVVVEGSVVESGDSGVDAVLAEPIEADGTTLGQITLGARPGQPYVNADHEKLRHYAHLAAHLIGCARRHRNWRQQALTDELSALPNRRFLLRFLDDVLDRASEQRFRVTLLLFDIDDFKTYNDTCGHDAGDEIIRVAARLFREHCRERDVVTRYGGDEFAVVFWDAEGARVEGSRHPQDAFDVLQRFTAALATAKIPQLQDLPRFRLTISGGLATYPWDAVSRDELIRKADAALIHAKRAGKNRVFLSHGDPLESPAAAAAPEASDEEEDRPTSS